MWSPAEAVCSYIIASFGGKPVPKSIWKSSLCSAKSVYAEDSYATNTLYRLQHGK